MCFGNQTSVINLDLTGKQSFLIDSTTIKKVSIPLPLVSYDCKFVYTIGQGLETKLRTREVA
jgi:hypothetical protein